MVVFLIISMIVLLMIGYAPLIISGRISDEEERRESEHRKR
jgi:hypothetical protein